jgi:hypothetical protein
MSRSRFAYAHGRTGAGTAAMGSGLATLGRVVSAIASIVAAIIVAGILLKVLGANPSNDIVSWVLDAARWLVGPFKGLFSIADADLRVVVNWGLAALVYLLIGRLIARLLTR